MLCGRRRQPALPGHWRGTAVCRIRWRWRTGGSAPHAP